MRPATSLGIGYSLEVGAKNQNDMTLRYSLQTTALPGESEENENHGIIHPDISAPPRGRGELARVSADAGAQAEAYRVTQWVVTGHVL